MTPSTTRNMTPSDPSVAALVSQKNAYQIIQVASNMARRLSNELRGGRGADPNVTHAAAIAVVRLSRQEKIFQELIASGEVSL